MSFPRIHQMLEYFLTEITSKLQCNCKSRTLIPFNPSDSNYIVDLNLGFDGLAWLWLLFFASRSPSILNEKKKNNKNQIRFLLSGLGCLSYISFRKLQGCRSILVGILSSSQFQLLSGGRLVGWIGSVSVWYTFKRLKRKSKITID